MSTVPADFTVRRTRESVGFAPRNDSAREWFQDNVPEPCYSRGWYYVDNVTAETIAQAIADDGMVAKWARR